MKVYSVCLIGLGHLDANPRLVKEADALYAAGYKVRVVSGGHQSMVGPQDKGLLGPRPWSALRVPYRSKWMRIPRKLRSRFAAKCVSWGMSTIPKTIAWSESELISNLVSGAAAEPADLYIGHCLPGLYAAWKASRKHHAALGFDVEDSHVDELPDTPEFRRQREARTRFERRLIADCQHFTASSPLIAARYEQQYGRRPEVVLNVFPRSEAPSIPVDSPYLEGRSWPTLYWFSQTIGAGRGLEEVIAAMGRMKQPVELHLRGKAAKGYREKLEAVAAQNGISKQLVWLSPASPDLMVRFSGDYDLGLALELSFPPNHRICLANKIFSYLLAGIPVVLSRTPAQEQLHAQLGEAGILIDLNDTVSFAAKLDTVLTNRAGLVVRRRAAWKLGQERFNWDREQYVLLGSVENAIRSSQTRTAVVPR